MHRTLIEYDRKLIELLKSIQWSFSSVQQAEDQGVRRTLTEDVREAYNQRFEEVSTLLVSAKTEAASLTAKLNGISVDGEVERARRRGSKAVEGNDDRHPQSGAIIL